MILIQTDKGMRKIQTSAAKTSINKFKGWYCNAGIDFLWINHEGYIFGNVCRHSGCYGNLYDNFELPKEPIICPANSCYCAADIEILKAKKKEDLYLFASNITNSAIESLKDYNDEEIHAIHGLNKTDQNRVLSINWNIGKRCNYSCSYCPPTVHDNHSPHMTFAVFKNAIDKIRNNIKIDSFQITFTGGEPTINPYYFDIVDYTNSLGGKVFTNTNGTCTEKKLLKLVNAGGVSLSVHAEFAQVEKLAKKISTVLNSNIEGILKVKYMLSPGGLDACKKFFDLIPKPNGNYRYSIEPLVDKLNDRKILEYSQEELDFIRGKQ